jgi:uroporphyrinogen decarboxylase
MALRHREPDRCPMDISFTPEFASRLRKYIGLETEDGLAGRGVGDSYLLERALQQDMLYTSVGFCKKIYVDEVHHGDDVVRVDEWGVAYKDVPYETEFGRGHYTEIVGHPLADDRAIDAYEPPDPNRPELYAEAARVIERHKDEYWITGGAPLTIWETAWGLRGLERALLDLVLNPDLVDKLLDIPLSYHLAAAERLVSMGVDMIRLADDVGAQDRMMMSPDTWRRFLKPRMATVISAVRNINPGVTVAYHSDGFISPIIPDLIEIGVDVLNPIQPACMDPAELKKLYGDRLCFWGSIDEQYTLPFGTPAEVRQEVLTRLATLGRGGGLIIGPTHMVQLDTPLENFWAMVNTITETPYRSLQRGSSAGPAINGTEFGGWREEARLPE